MSMKLSKKDKTAKIKKHLVEIVKSNPKGAMSFYIENYRNLFDTKGEVYYYSIFDEDKTNIIRFLSIDGIDYEAERLNVDELNKMAQKYNLKQQDEEEIELA